jgi:hypothetical protein
VEGELFEGKESMRKQLELAIVVLLLGTACIAQDRSAIQLKGKQQGLPEEAQEIYLSACATVQQEFGPNHTVSPKVTLVLGAEKDGVFWETGEIRLRKWDRYLFAQGVVILGFRDLMPIEQKLTMAKRAVSWADATINVQQLRK